MLIKFKISENIDKQKEEIIGITKEPTGSLKEIIKWINQNPESLSNDISLLAILIDTIHFYFKREYNQKKEMLIESFFCKLVKNFSNLSSEQILTLLSYLKAYIQTRDDEAKSVLEKYTYKLAYFPKRSLFIDISKQIAFLHAKSKSSFNMIFKSQPSDLSIIELVSETAELNSAPECKFSLSEEPVVFSTEFINAPPNEKIFPKKIKERIINFDDDDGIGYDHCASHWYFKEIKRLDKINLEIELSPRMRFKEEFMRLSKIYTDQEITHEELKKQIAEKEFDLFASKKEKAARLRDEEEKQQTKQRLIEKSIQNKKDKREYLRIKKLLDPVVSFIQNQIDQCKEEISDNNKLSLDLRLPSFEGMKNDFLADFLKKIDYKNLKELINFSQSILFFINEINKTLKKIDFFSKSLGVSVNYIDSLDNFHEKIKKNFTMDIIIKFLESSLTIFKQRTLNSDNDYCLLKIENQKEKIEFSEPDFLNSFISENSLNRIVKLNSECLDQFFNQNEDSILFHKRRLENKNNFLKVLFNFLLGKYYFFSQKHKNKFVKKFFLDAQECPNFESIKTGMLKLKWWHFILIGISPIHIFKKGFRELLSEKLFLNLLEEEFKNIDKKPCVKSVDNLYSIQDRLKSSNIGFKSYSINLALINVPQSRQEIIISLNKHQEIKDFLDKVSVLINHTTGCLSEFSKTKKVFLLENEKIVSPFDLAKNYFFKATISESFLPNKSLSYFLLNK